MRTVDQWGLIESGLDDAWDTVLLSFAAEESGALADAAAVLAPLGPGRVGDELRFVIARGQGGPEKLRNLLGHLDRKRIWGSLTLVDAHRRQPTERQLAAKLEQPRSLAERWDAEVARLPPGWRDLLCELQLDSTDFLPRAALLGAPLNPTRNRDAVALRFRASSGGGYGTASAMVRRCLERMDTEGITGRVVVLTALSNTDDVGTQGPVWRVAGRSV